MLFLIPMLKGGFQFLQEYEPTSMMSSCTKRSFVGDICGNFMVYYIMYTIEINRIDAAPVSTAVLISVAQRDLGKSNYSVPQTFSGKIILLRPWWWSEWGWNRSLVMNVTMDLWDRRMTVTILVSQNIRRSRQENEPEAHPTFHSAGSSASLTSFA